MIVQYLEISLIHNFGVGSWCGEREEIVIKGKVYAYLVQTKEAIESDICQCNFISVVKRFLEQ